MERGGFLVKRAMGFSEEMRWDSSLKLEQQWWKRRTRVLAKRGRDKKWSGEEDGL